jgi:hypothetical protein
MCNCEFGQAHCVGLFKRVHTKFILQFWTFLQFSIKFGSLNYFLLFKIIQKRFENARTGLGLKPAHGMWYTGEVGPRAVARRPAARPGPQARLACKRDIGARRAHPPHGHRAPASRGGAVTIGEPMP